MLLRRIRAAIGGPIILFKGADLAARFPDPLVRPYGDLDLLVPDAQAAHAALRDAGFREADDEINHLGSHNLVPLRWPGSPLPIEIHQALPWVTWAPAPEPAALFSRAVPSAVGIDGLLAFAPEDYALILAAHAWRHHPLADVLHLLDIAVVADTCDRQTLMARAEAWRMERMWAATDAAIAALFRGGLMPAGIIGYCVRQLRQGGERRAVEYFLMRWLSALWASTPRERVVGIARDVRAAVRARPNKSRRLLLAQLVRGGHRSMVEYYQGYERRRMGG